MAGAREYDRRSASAFGRRTDTLDGLLGEPLPLDWSDEDYARVGTGRRPLTDDERARLGPLADRLPLLACTHEDDDRPG